MTPIDTWGLVFSAFALMLVVEGVLPFFNPKLWRSVFERAMRLSDGQLRFIGLSFMLAGLLILILFLN